jgi:hypothetical protein
LKPFEGGLESHAVLELTSSPQCLLSHVVLKSSASDQYKLFYRSSNYVDTVQLHCDDEDTELSEEEREALKGNREATQPGEWTAFEFLTPDWTDVKEEKVLIVDITEQQCKSIGYINAIRLEVKNSTKSNANSFHGVHVYGWNASHRVND